jgi:hypothetical protein
VIGVAALKRWRGCQPDQGAWRFIPMSGKKGDRHRPVFIGNVEHESTRAVILGRYGACVV